MKKILILLTGNLYGLTEIRASIYFIFKFARKVKYGSKI